MTVEAENTRDDTHYRISCMYVFQLQKDLSLRNMCTHYGKMNPVVTKTGSLGHIPLTKFVNFT